MNDGVDFLGTIPYDRTVTQAQMKAMAVVEFDAKASSSRAIREIWKLALKKIRGEGGVE